MESVKTLVRLLAWTYNYGLLVDGEIGYVLFVYGGVVSFEQHAREHKVTHDVLGEAIKTSRGGLAKVILCGKGSAYNAELGVDATFDDFTPEGVEEVKVKVAALAAPMLNAYRLDESRSDLASKNIYVVNKLIAEFRYEDARMHCAVTGLNFERFLEEARNRLDPTRLF